MWTYDPFPIELDLGLPSAKPLPQSREALQRFEKALSFLQDGIRLHVGSFFDRDSRARQAYSEQLDFRQRVHLLADFVRRHADRVDIVRVGEDPSATFMQLARVCLQAQLLWSLVGSPRPSNDNPPPSPSDDAALAKALDAATERTEMLDIELECFWEWLFSLPFKPRYGNPNTCDCIAGTNGDELSS